jgi:hypothetical protein
MQFRNFTPFPALAYQALDQLGERHHVIAMRQTLVIHPDSTLRYADDQEPLAVVDEYFGEINRSSVRQESDLAPFKPKCDVIIVAAAYAPGGFPATTFDVRLRIIRTGDAEAGEVMLEKTLAITGPRFWEKSRLFRAWHLSEPEPITSLPIRYEYAYGGELRLENTAERERLASEGKDPESAAPLHHSVVESNPVGCGYREDDYLKLSGLARVPAPRIEDPRDRVSSFGTHHAPQGFGVITKAWLPRRQLAGTADEAFAKSDGWLPEDFDFAFWNGAHPDLQIPYLDGDEIVELTNVVPTGMLQIQLPGHRPYLLVRYEEGEIEPVAMNLDTLLIDIERMRVALVYRMTMALEPAVRVIEARFISRKDWDAAAVARRSQFSAGKEDDLESFRG